MFVRQFRIALYKTVKWPITNKWNMAMCDNQYIHVILADRKRERALTHLWHKYERAPLKTKWAQRNGMKWKVKFSVSAGYGLLYVIFFSLHLTFLFTLQILSRILSMNAQLTAMVMFDISTNEIWIFFAFIWREIVN